MDQQTLVRAVTERAREVVNGALAELEVDQKTKEKKARKEKRILDRISETPWPL